MRQNSPQKRGRGRPGGRRPPHGNNANRNFESNGPEVKIRGNAAHVAEKYQVLSRDASASGDRIAAEGYLQHAEHYIRIFQAANAQAAERQQAVERQRGERQTEAPSNQRGDSGDSGDSGGGNGEDRAAPLVDNRAVEKPVDTPQPVVPDSAYDYLIKEQTAQAADAAPKAASPSAPEAASAAKDNGDGEAAAPSERKPSKPRTRRAPRRKPAAAEADEAEASPVDKGEAA